MTEFLKWPTKCDRMKEKDAKEHISGVFTRASTTYDRVGTKFYSHFGTRLVELIKIPEKAKVLDVASGRGASLFPAVTKVGREGAVIGIDLAEGMVKETTLELKRAGIANADMILMDAENLKFNENTFDIVLCGFGIFFFPQYEEALNEALRVLKPAGRIGISTFVRVEQNHLKWLSEVIQKYLPPPQKEKREENSEKPEFDTSEGMLKILTTAGFQDVQTVIEKKDFFWKNAEECWKEAWSHGLRLSLEKIPSGDLVEFKEDVITCFNKHKQVEGVRQTIEVLFTFGTK